MTLRKIECLFHFNINVNVWTFFMSSFVLITARLECESFFMCLGNFFVSFFLCNEWIEFFLRGVWTNIFKSFKKSTFNSIQCQSNKDQLFTFFPQQKNLQQFINSQIFKAFPSTKKIIQLLQLMTFKWSQKLNIEHLNMIDEWIIFKLIFINIFRLSELKFSVLCVKLMRVRAGEDEMDRV